MTAYRPGNVLIVGSTRSGKSKAEESAVLAAAEDQAAIVIADPHRDSLAAGCFRQLVARGYQRQIIFDQVSELSVAPGYQFLRPSLAPDVARRYSENDQAARDFMDVLCRRRELKSIATAPLTEEWIYHATRLLLSQDRERPAYEIVYAFRPGHPILHELLDGSSDADAYQRFHDVETGAIKRGEYASAQRLAEGTCGAPAFMARCGTTFNLPGFLDAGGFLLLEGGTRGISADALLTVLGAVILLVISYVRSRPVNRRRVLLVLDEASNANLLSAGGAEVRAAAELQKNLLDMHVLVQSPNFPSAEVDELIFTNCVRHHWHFQANDAVARRGAADLGHPQYRDRLRELAPGERLVKDHGSIYFEYVPLLEDPWVFPGLSEAKAAQALTEIRARPEYQTASCIAQKFQRGTRVTKRSSTAPADTSACQDISSSISPAQRLATGGSKRSSKGDSSAKSGTS